jgi:hypothetical protein
VFDLIHGLPPQREPISCWKSRHQVVVTNAGQSQIACCSTGVSAAKSGSDRRAKVGISSNRSTFVRLATRFSGHNRLVMPGTLSTCARGNSSRLCLSATGCCNLWIRLGELEAMFWSLSSDPNRKQKFDAKVASENAAIGCKYHNRRLCYAEARGAEKSAR